MFCPVLAGLISFTYAEVLESFAFIYATVFDTGRFLCLSQCCCHVGVIFRLSVSCLLRWRVFLSLRLFLLVGWATIFVVLFLRKLRDRFVFACGVLGAGGRS